MLSNCIKTMLFIFPWFEKKKKDYTLASGCCILLMHVLCLGFVQIRFTHWSTMCFFFYYLLHIWVHEACLRSVRHVIHDSGLKTHLRIDLNSLGKVCLFKENAWIWKQNVCYIRAQGCSLHYTTEWHCILAAVS